jgi:SAM-dependent methyltransferase
MVTTADRLSAREANRVLYDEVGAHKYVDSAPHLKHRQIREFHTSLIESVHSAAAQNTDEVRVLDLGAGEGSCASKFLQLGAKVTAVDISAYQLQRLQVQCKSFSQKLGLRHEDAWETLERPDRYDVVVANSFLHHVPDYLALIGRALPHIEAKGQFFSFADPLRYDTMSKASYVFSNTSYFAWRLFQGHLWQGLKTRIRRMRGIYIADSKEDDAEYHVTRNGVDQIAICSLLESNGFECTLMRYFSTQSAILQRVGSWLALPNKFAIIARRR